jgi:hypothetical protein
MNVADEMFEVRVGDVAAVTMLHSATNSIHNTEESSKHIYSVSHWRSHAHMYVSQFAAACLGCNVLRSCGPTYGPSPVS